MQTLSVVAVEDGALVVASPGGERFRLPVDAALRSRLLATGAPREERRLSPREIQAHVRSGLSAEQVAAMTGVPVASIERFVGPVLAERAYIVESALAVRLPPETDGARSRTFGAVMGERLDALAARDVRWSSAKEPAGWVLSVRFTADDTAHDARWRFDAKHMSLEPDNVEASTLSQQGVPAALTPRLRAIEPTAPVAVIAPAAAETETPQPGEGAGRFDSAAFALDPQQVRPGARRAQPERRGRRTADPADRDLPETSAMDLLPAPRGREAGEVFAARPAAADPAPQAARGATRTKPGRDAFGRAGTAPRRDEAPARREEAPVVPLRNRHVERTPVEDRPTEPLRRRRERTQPQPTAPVPPADDGGARARRGRTSMPSWDEIVFGRDES